LTKIVDHLVRQKTQREVTEKLTAKILETAKTVFDSDEYGEIEWHAKSRLVMI